MALFGNNKKEEEKTSPNNGGMDQALRAFGMSPETPTKTTKETAEKKPLTSEDDFSKALEAFDIETKKEEKETGFFSRIGQSIQDIFDKNEEVKDTGFKLDEDIELAGLPSADDPKDYIKIDIPERVDDSKEPTLAYKNNNPFNLKFRGQPNAEEGEGGFAKFATKEDGVVAGVKQIMLDVSREQTLKEFIYKYAPPEENNTQKYLSRVSKALGVSSNTKLNKINISKLAKQIAHEESNSDIRFLEKPTAGMIDTSTPEAMIKTEGSTVPFITKKGDKRVAFGEFASKTELKKSGSNIANVALKHALQGGKMIFTALRAAVEVGSSYFGGKRKKVLEENPEMGKPGSVGYYLDKYIVEKNFDEEIEKASEKAIENLDAAQNILMSQTRDNKKGYSLSEIVALISDGTFSLLEGIAVYKVTNSPNASAMFITSLETLDTYNEARENHLSPQASLHATAKQFAGTFILEKIGWDFLVKSGFSSGFLNAVKKAFFETGQELTQEIYQNISTKHDYDESQKVFANLVEVAIATFPSVLGLSAGGGIISNIERGRAIKRISKEADISEKKAEKFIDLLEKQYKEQKQDVDEKAGFTQEDLDEADDPSELYEEGETEEAAPLEGEEATPITGLRIGVVKHGSKVSEEQIKKEGFVPTEKGALGPGVYFSDSESMVEQRTVEDTIEIDPNNFNLLQVDSLKQRREIMDKANADTISEAADALGYDGVIETNPDERVGNTFVMTNTEKLNKAIRGELEAQQYKRQGLDLFQDVDWAKNYHRQSQEVVEMNPQEFINQVPEVPLDRETIENIKTEIQTGGRVEPMFLDVNSETGDIVGHEGRHRAVALKELGYEGVPVIRFYKNNEGQYVESPEGAQNWNKKIQEVELERMNQIRQDMQEQLDIKTPEERAKENVLGEMKAAQAGRRFWIAREGPGGVVSVDEDLGPQKRTSTFPKWVPEGSLRTRKMFDGVIKHIENETEPNEGTRARELYDIVQKEIKKQAESGYTGPPVEEQVYGDVVSESRPEISRVTENGYDWNQFADEDKAAVRAWVEHGGEGLPPGIVDKYSETTEVGEDHTPEIDESTYILSEEEVVGFSANKNVDNILMLDIDPMVATEKLVTIAKTLGIPGIAVQELKGGKGGHIRYKAEAPIDIEIFDLANPLTLSHEIGHLFDISIIGKSKTGQYKVLKTLNERLEGEGFELKIEEQVMWDELKKITQFLRPFKTTKSTGYTAYRHRRGELFADWFASYLNDYSATKLIAPNFTAQMEERYGNELKWIRNVYQFNTEDTKIRSLPEKFAEQIKSGVLNVMDAMETDEDDSEVVTKTRQHVNNLELRFMDFFQIPKWVGEKYPEFGEVWEFVTKKTVHEYNGRKADIFNESEIEEIRKSLPDESRERLAKVLYLGNKRGIHKEFEEEELREGVGNIRGLNDEEVHAYKKIRQALDMVKENKVEGFKHKYGYYDMEESEQKTFDDWIEKEVDKIEGWVPLKRQGDYFLYAEITDQKGDTATYFEGFDNKNEAKNRRDLLKKMGYEKTHIYPKGGKLPGKYVDQMARNASWSMLETFAEQEGLADEEGVEKIIERLKELGMTRPLMRRRNVPGYTKSFDNFYKALVSEINQSTRLRYKEEAITALNKKINQIDGHAKPTLVRYMRHYRDSLFRASDESWVGVRKLIYIKYLAWKTSFAVQNLTQPFLTTYPEIFNHVGAVEGHKIFAKGYKMMAKYYLQRMSDSEKSKLPDKVVKGFEKLSKNIELDQGYIDLMDRAIKENLVTGAFNEQILGTIDKKKSKMENAISIFGIFSEMANRGHSVAAAYQIAETKDDINTDDEYFDFAKLIDDRTQFSYGKHNVPVGLQNLPSVLRGPAKTAFVFKSFMLNYLHFASQRIVGGSALSKVTGFGSLVSLGGITALPFYQLISSLLRWIMGWFGSGTDPDEELYKAFNDEYEFLADTILKGIPTWVGMDMSTMLGVGDIINPNFDINGQILGPGYGIVDDFTYGTELLSRGDYGRAAEKLAPLDAVGNIASAIRHAERGYDFYDTGVYKPSSFEITQEGLGFTPHNVSKEYDISNIKEAKRNEYYEILSEYKNAYRRGKDIGVDSDIMKKVTSHNRGIRDSLFYLYEGSAVLTKGDAEKKFSSIYKSLTISFDDMKRWRRDVNEKKAKLKSQ